MEVFDSPNYKFVKILLISSGLWPGQNKHVKFIIILLFFAINLSMTVPQIILLIKKWGKDMDITFENTASILFAFSYSLKFGVQHLQSFRLELLLKELASDWNSLTDKRELKILAKNTEQGRILTIIFTINAWMVYSVMPLAPLFLDIVFPINGTRNLLMPFFADYIFFDQKDYHYWVCGHITIVYLSSIITIASLEGILIVCVKHVCSLFEIICYRIHNLSEDDVKHDICMNNFFTKKNLINIIRLHNRSIRCSKMIRDAFCGCLMVTQQICIINLTITGTLLLVMKISFMKNLRILEFSVGLIIHLFIINLIGQQIIDNSLKVYYATCDSKWHKLPINLRKYIILLLNRSMKSCELTSGKVTNLSLKNFGLVMKRTISFLTAVLSFREEIIGKLHNRQILFASAD